MYTNVLLIHFAVLLWCGAVMKDCVLFMACYNPTDHSFSPSNSQQAPTPPYSTSAQIFIERRNGKGRGKKKTGAWTRIDGHLVYGAWLILHESDYCQWRPKKKLAVGSNLGRRYCSCLKDSPTSKCVSKWKNKIPNKSFVREIRRIASDSGWWTFSTDPISCVQIVEIKVKF